MNPIHTKLNLNALMLLLAGTTVLGQSPQEFPYLIPYELGDGEFASGDSITIQEFRGTTNTIQTGELYYVSGSYTLNSQDEAELSFFATTTNRTPTPIDARQTMHVSKGTGTFRLIKQMTEPGYLHVTFYSKTTGQGFGGVYFGEGQWVLHDKKFSYLRSSAHAGKSSASVAVSSAGPNEVLFEYLGNPVQPPANMDLAYTKSGLARAMQTAAQAAGISLAKVEIDDSEFPFLVGLVFANSGDKEKLKVQIGKEPAYGLSGGVGGDTTYAMNIVPPSAFPPSDSQHIYRRMLLREAVLHDRILGLR